MDTNRRDYINSKYPAMNWRPMGPALNNVVQNVLAAQQIEDRGFTRGTEWHQWLFDPARSPRMHIIATEAHRDMRRAIASGDIECENPNDPNEVLVYFVGSRHAHAVKRGKSADRLAATLRLHDATQPYCDTYECNIQIDDECRAAHGLGCAGGSTMLMPLLFGGVLMIFECCMACHHVARKLATDGYKLSALDAEMGLLAGDRIDVDSVTPAPPIYGYPTTS